MDDMRSAQNSIIEITEPLLSNGLDTTNVKCDSRQDKLFQQANGCGYICKKSSGNDRKSFLNTADSNFYTDTAVMSHMDDKRDSSYRFLLDSGCENREESFVIPNDIKDTTPGRDDNIRFNIKDVNTSSVLLKGAKSNSAHVQFETLQKHSIVGQSEDVVELPNHKRTGSPYKFAKIFSRLHKHTSQSDDILPNLRKHRKRWKSSSSTSIGSSSTFTSESRDTEFERRAPDGGWGWVVVFASFMVHCIADGVTMSFGVLYVEFLSYFQESKARTSWIGSFFMAIPLLAGPLASFVTDKYGCKVVTIWGSIIACIGFVLSAFANSVTVLFFTVGLITGLGHALCYVAAIVILAFYFEKKRSLATGIAVAGSGIGTFLFAPLIHHLIKQYGWRGCLIILAGAFLNMAVCGFLMRDLEWTRKKPERGRGGTLSESSDVFQSSISAMPSPRQIKRIIQTGKVDMLFLSDDVSANIARSSSLVMLPTFLKKSQRIPKELLTEFSNNKYEIISQHYPDYLTKSLTGSRNCLDDINTLLQSAEISKKRKRRKELKAQLSLHKEESSKYHVCRSSSCFDHLSDKNDNINIESKPIMVEYATQNAVCKSKLTRIGGKYSGDESRKIADSGLTPISEDILRLKRQSMTFRGAMFNIHRYRLRSSSCPNIYKNSALPRKQTKKQNNLQILRVYLEEAKSCFTIERYCKLDFITFAASNFILYVFYDTVYMYLSDYALGVGMTPDQSAGLIAFTGILNCIGVVLMGYVADKEWCSPLILYLLSMVFCGASVVVMPFLQSYIALASAAAVFGLFISANYALTSVILVNLTSLNGFGKAYGLILLIQGIANLIGPPFVGMLADATGQYVLPFVISGSFIILCGLMLAIIPGVQKHRATSTALRDELQSGVDI